MTSPITPFPHDPGVEFQDPIDPQSLPKGRPFFVTAAWGLAIAVTGLLAFVQMGKPPAIGIIAACSLATAVIALIIGGSRQQKISAAKTANQLHDLGIRAIQTKDRDLAKRLYEPIDHLGKWLRHGSRGLDFYAETTIQTQRGELAVRLFLHKYTVQTNNSTQTYYHWVALTPAPDAWPALTLTNENFLAKIGKAFGGADIQLDSEDFNNRWIVKGDNEDFAIVALSPDVQAALTEGPRSESWVFGNGALACIRAESLPPPKVREFAERAASVRAALPPELEHFEQPA